MRKLKFYGLMALGMGGALVLPVVAIAKPSLITTAAIAIVNVLAALMMVAAVVLPIIWFACQPTKRHKT